MRALSASELSFVTAAGCAPAPSCKPAPVCKPVVVCKPVCPTLDIAACLSALFKKFDCTPTPPKSGCGSSGSNSGGGAGTEAS